MYNIIIGEEVMKKNLLVSIVLFVLCLVLTGCESKPKWVVLGQDDQNESVLSINTQSISKIQKEEIDKNVRINSSAPIKRDVYSVWVKRERGSQPDREFWEIGGQDGKKIHHVMYRYFIDLTNRESFLVESIFYYETGTTSSQTFNAEWIGIVPETIGEVVLTTLVKYK